MNIHEYMNIYKWNRYDIFLYFYIFVSINISTHLFLFQLKTFILFAPQFPLLVTTCPALIFEGLCGVALNYLPSAEQFPGCGGHNPIVPSRGEQSPPGAVPKPGASLLPRGPPASLAASASYKIK